MVGKRRSLITVALAKMVYNQLSQKHRLTAFNVMQLHETAESENLDMGEIKHCKASMKE
jgi:hypothetical protein